jgi:hypothetical protein
MTACSVEYVKRVVDRRGRRFLVLEWLADAYGMRRSLPEPAARALARSVARERQLGARVVGPERQDLAWFVWVPSRGAVVEAAPGTDWRQIR